MTKTNEIYARHFQEMGDALRMYRNRSKLSRQALAQMCGVSAYYLQQLEHGDANPTLIVVDKICTALKLEPWQRLKHFWLPVKRGAPHRPQPAPYHVRHY